MGRGQQTGFTLVEVSIVLVVIGLVVGGMLVGQNLIEAARIRHEVSDLEKFSAAINTFRGKYLYLPGDMPYAVSQGLGLSGLASSTQGNGLIDDRNGLAPIRDAYSEPYYFFIQLSDAGLIEGRYAYQTLTFAVGHGHQFPPLATNENYGLTVSSWLGDVWYYLGISTNNYVGTQYVVSLSQKPVLTPGQAHGIDTKVDDGVPISGRVIAVVPNLGGGAVLDGTRDVTPGQCVLDAAAQTYNISSSGYWCRLYVKAQ